MPISDLLPWNRGNTRLPVKRESNDLATGLPDPMTQLVDEFFNDSFDLAPFRQGTTFGGQFYPRIDLIENDKELIVSVEVPGMDENDIQVSMNDNLLSLSGHKETEKEEKGKRFHRIERSSGSFRRDIPLPVEVDQDRVEAVFKNGVVTVTLPKIESTQVRGKRISVRKG
jgi:HSP20 family protein